MRILHIEFDALSPDGLGYYDYHRDTSPGINRIDDSGRRFTNYSTSDTPYLSSRTALFTEQFGINMG